MPIKQPAQVRPPEPKAEEAAPSASAPKPPVLPSPDITGKGLTGHAPTLLDLLWLGISSKKKKD